MYWILAKHRRCYMQNDQPKNKSRIELRITQLWRYFGGNNNRDSLYFITCLQHPNCPHLKSKNQKGQTCGIFNLYLHPFPPSSSPPQMLQFLHQHFASLPYQTWQHWLEKDIFGVTWPQCDCINNNSISKEQINQRKRGESLCIHKSWNLTQWLYSWTMTSK